MKKIFCSLFLLILLVSVPLGNVQASVTTKYPVDPVYPPPLVRPPVKVSPERLPEGSTGAYPTYDGEPFQVNLPPKLVIEPNEGETRKVVDQVLPAMGWERDPRELVFVEQSKLPVADASYIEQQLKQEQVLMTRNLQDRLGKLSPATLQAVQDVANLYRTIALHEQQMFIYDQRFNDLRVEYARVIVHWQAGYGLSSIAGRVFNQVDLENKPDMEAAQAVEAAMGYIARTSKPLDSPQPDPELVIYPYEKSFLYAWRMDVATPDGSYRLWLDASTGQVLELLPLFFSDDGQGLAFVPSPLGGTQVIGFKVDSPVSGNYQLLLTGKLDVNNRGADGVTSTDLTIPAGSTSFADFNISPYNGTVVDCITDPNYNSRFQEINAYATIYSQIFLYQLLGSQTFGSMNVDVNDSYVCGFGINNSCSGGTHLAFGLGSATRDCSSSGLFNGALDGTVIAHELGHTLNGLQYSHGGGTLHGSLNEGLADFWGSTLFNTDTFGAYWGQNSAAPVQTGWVPRQAEALDVFPEHRSIGGHNSNAEIHADGQMVDWALWSSRTGLNSLGPLGSLLIDITLLKAEDGAGVGISSAISDSGVHAAFLNLLRELANEHRNSVTLYKVLSGFARAGMTLAERDAIIDIDDDWLANSAANGPTFTIFTGRDFQISGTDAVSTSSFNTDYEVEVANDVNFTVNHVTSGNQTNVAVTTQGMPQATWTLPTADWNTLKTGTRLYYRVTTRDHSSGNVRTSGRPGNGFLENVPPAYAVINSTGQYVCTCGPTTGATTGDRAMAALLLVPLAVAFIWRRRSL